MGNVLFKTNNILSIKNTARPQGDLGGTFSHSYTYDDLSRLTGANGVCRDTISYALQMAYDIMSNPLRKTQTVKGSDIAASHDLHFAYGHAKPNAVTEISGTRYEYDPNGNPTLIATDSTHREMAWDEENRMLSLNDDGHVSRYTYDHTGTRTVKSHGPMEAVYVNGAPQGINYHDEENYTVYVSPYLIATADRFTKYYYNGTQRIAAKLGTGEFDNVYGVNNFHLTAGQKDYAERMVQIEESRQEYMKQNGIPPGVPTQKGQNIEPEITGVALPNKPLGNYDVPDGWPTKPHFNEKGDVPGPPLQWEEPEDLGNVEAGYGYKSNNEEENDIFFFHTDHLGSTSYLTDKDGNACEYVCYMPYGESIVDENNTDDQNIFKFTGKELDRETGQYYFEQRYYNPFDARFTTIDPRYEEYPSLSPWNYCNSNPLVFIDPTGMDGEWWRTVWNTIKDPDGLEGKADPANTGEVTKQDMKVGFATIGGIVTGAGIVYEGISIFSSLLLVNCIDDMGADKNAESISQQMIQNETGKKAVEYVKIGIDAASVYKSGKIILNTNDATIKAIETTNIINTTTSEIVNNNIDNDGK